MVPTFTCGLVRSNFFFAISFFRPFAESPPRGSNPRPRPYQGRALPTELGGRHFAGQRNEVARRNPARLEHPNGSANGASGGARPPRAQAVLSSSERLAARRRTAGCWKGVAPSTGFTTWVYPCASSSWASRRPTASRRASIESWCVSVNTASHSRVARQGSHDVLISLQTI